MKKIVSVVLALLCMMTATGCSSGSLFQNAKGSGIVASGKDIPKGKAVTLASELSEVSTYNKVASNDKFNLYYNALADSIYVSSIDESIKFYSGIDCTNTENSMTKVWKQNVSSMFEISYSQPNSNGRERVITASTRKIGAKVYSKTTENGISLTYYFPKRKMGFTADITLTNNGISVSIPPESFIENDKFRFVSITPLPYFGAIDAETDGYILSPYSGGALLNLGESTRSTFLKHPIYSEENPSLDEIDKLVTGKEEDSYSESTVVSLPIVGMSDNKSGFIEYATSGEENGSINVSTAYYGISYNRVSMTFLIHNISYVNASKDEDDVAILLDNDIIPTNKTVNFDLLSGNEVTYSDMAQRYRDYLISTGLLSSENNAKSTLSVEFFMGASEERIIGNRMIVATTFAQVEEMLADMYKKGIRNAVVNLKGWNKGGYAANPTSALPDSSLGSVDELKAISDYCKKIGYLLYLEANITDLDTNLTEVSAKRVSVVDSNGFILNNKAGNRYWQQLGVMKNNLNDILKKADKYSADGLVMDKFGSIMYRDYHDSLTYATAYSDGIREMISSIKKQLGSVAVRGTNLYALCASDYVYDVAFPIADSVKYSAYIPFLQLVVGRSVGLVTMPENSYYNPVLQKLLLLEYGMIPNFEITSQSVYDLRNTQYNKLFSAKYDLWIDNLTEEYEKYSKSLSTVFDSRMIKHELINENISKVSYENGCVLYINKSNSDFMLDNDKITKNSYLLVGKGGSGVEN